MWSFIAGIIPALIKPIGNILKERSARKTITNIHNNRIEEAKVLAKIERIKSGDISSTELDAISLRKDSWKDEILLIIAVLPLVMVFFPQSVYLVSEGFDSLELVPDWYMYIILGLYIDTFGFRRMIREFFSNKFRP